MDKQTFVLKIVKHYIYHKIDSGACSTDGSCDNAAAEAIKAITCRACKIYDQVVCHVRAHEKSPDGECHLN